MSPRDYIQHDPTGAPAVPGVPSPPAPITVDAGDCIGVVCMSTGGPTSLNEVYEQLYRRYMDPALLYLPIGGFIRSGFARLMANLRHSDVATQYEMIGGHSPLVPLMKEQTHALSSRLRRLSASTGATFRTYTAHRYGPTTFADTAIAMQNDGVDKVILLPMSAQYGHQRAASWLRYWSALEETGEIPEWPTTAIHEFAIHPAYVQAIRERIDEAMQRFDASLRPDIHLLFTAEGVPTSEVDRHRDPSCCLTAATVDHVMRRRSEDRPFHIAFQNPVGPSRHLVPSVQQTIETLAQNGTRAVLTVPITYLTGCIETHVDLDIELREQAMDAGIEAFEVTQALNSHPLLIDALAEGTLAQCQFRNVSEHAAHGDGAPPQHIAELTTKPLRQHPSEPSGIRAVDCPACPEPRANPILWGDAQEFVEPAPHARPAPARTAREPV